MISQAQWEAYLGISAGTDVTILTAIEAAVVQWLQNQTGRYFGAAGAFTEYVGGNGQRNLYLQDIPNSITSVTQQGYPGDTQTTITAGDDDGYELRDQHLVRKGGYVWEWDEEYIVVYNRGYATNAEPADIRLVAYEMIKALYNGGDPVGSAIRSEKIGDYSYTLGAAEESILFDSIPILRETLYHWRQVNV